MSGLTHEEEKTIGSRVKKIKKTDRPDTSSEAITPPSKKIGNPPPPATRTAKKPVGPIIFEIGQVGLFRSSSATCVSPGISDETGWSPRSYPIIGRSDQF